MSKNILILAEKKMLGEAIANVLPGQATGRKPIVKGEYTIMWLDGHILTLKEPEDYDSTNKSWNLDRLPLYYENWGQKCVSGKEKTLDIVGMLLRSADEVIHAGDPDDEGQFLVDEVLRWFNYRGPVKRLATDDTTQEALKKAMANLKDNQDYEPNGWAAYARSVSDLMVGINMTRYYTCLNGGQLLSVGRVQTPTLGLVVNRDRQIENHVRQKYYTVQGVMNIAGQDVPFAVQLDKKDERLQDGRITNRDLAEEIKKILLGANGSGMQVDPVTILKKNETEQPPLPFNLVELQTYCGQKFGYDPQKVMDITQTLRMPHDAITYNRSDCQYISTAEYREAPNTTRVVCDNIHFRPKRLDPTIKSRAVNDANVTAHHAIIPTAKELDLSTLSDEERNVYLAVCKYYLAQFLPPAQKLKTTLSASIPGNFELTSSSTEILDPGYRTIFSEAEPPEQSPLSSLAEGDYTGKVVSVEISEKETNPPTAYTKTTLNKDMTRIAKYVTDPEVKKLLLQKDKEKKGENGSIGTPATRSTIIDTLEKRGYVEVKGKKLVSTQLGRDFYDMLPNDLKLPDMTAHWWVIQEQIKSGECEYSALPESVLESICEILKQTPPGKIESAGPTARTVIGRCPRCGGDIVVGKKGYGCANYKAGCKFTIWKNPKSSLFQKITITENMAKQLLNGETLTSSSLYSANKNTKFYGGFRLRDTGADYGAELEFIPMDREPIGVCPRCGGNVVETKICFHCNGPDCKFAIWKKAKSGMFKDVPINAAQAKRLLDGKAIKSDKLYSKNKDDHFSGSFVLDDSNRSEFGANLKYVADERYVNRTSSSKIASSRGPNETRALPKSRGG